VGSNVQIIDVDLSRASSTLGFYVGGQKGSTVSLATSFLLCDAQVIEDVLTRQVELNAGVEAKLRALIGQPSHGGPDDEQEDLFRQFLPSTEVDEELRRLGSASFTVHFGE
jgi:hypothetical protein